MQDWRNFMVKVMTQLGEESNLTRDIYPLVESMANEGDLGDKWKARVRATLEENSSDCDAYTGRYDLFENKSKGMGNWALRNLKKKKNENKFAIAPTDLNWFEQLRNEGYDQSPVNFWTPTPWNIKQLRKGDKLFFMLKSPIRKIGGYGEFIDYQNMTPSEAWQKYGTNNGVKNLEDLEARTKFYIDKQSADNSHDSIGCILLDSLEFFNNEDFKSPEDYLGVNFPNQVVKIKYFDINSKERKIFKPKDLTIEEEFISQKSAKKKKTQISANQRKGQQKFRDEILNAYDNKCSITGINDKYALEAAHIENYINEKSNHIKNGICLRADIHKLFDQNLIGINGDFKLFISPKLKDKEYTKFKNKKINLPKNKDFQPLKKLLAEKFKSFRR